jgi:hypothetical protein
MNTIGTTELLEDEEDVKEAWRLDDAELERTVADDCVAVGVDDPLPLPPPPQAINKPIGAIVSMILKNFI